MSLVVELSNVSMCVIHRLFQKVKIMGQKAEFVIKCASLFLKADYWGDIWQNLILVNP